MDNPLYEHWLTYEAGSDASGPVGHDRLSLCTMGLRITGPGGPRPLEDCVPRPAIGGTDSDGIEWPCQVRIGRRFRIDSHGRIVISGDASFGDDVVLRQGVTVGWKNVAVDVPARILPRT